MEREHTFDVFFVFFFRRSQYDRYIEDEMGSVDGGQQLECGWIARQSIQSNRAYGVGGQRSRGVLFNGGKCLFLCWRLRTISHNAFMSLNISIIFHSESTYSHHGDRWSE